ncbi:MAG: sulfatase-like hydrolase/transferase, partial [Pseudomonadota bacterium]
MNPHALRLLATLVLLIPLIAQSDEPPRPNIVLVVMDNFGWGEVGAYGGGVLRGAPTPRIDSIAAEGLKLLNFNVEAECTPSRASLMTGRFGIRTRQRPGDLPQREIWYGITQWEVTMAEMLSDAGYATALFGKWHLGDTEGRFPTDQGFDEWYGIPRSSDRSFWPDSDSLPLDAGIELTHVMQSRRGEAPEQLDVYDLEKRRAIDRELTTRTIDYMDRQVKAGKPFFTWVSYTQTHEPVEAHPDFKGTTRHGAFADVLAQTDSYIGELLDAVDRLGIRDNTLFIFTADNGREGIPGSFGFTGPWRAGMFSPWEGSMRVSFLARWPAQIPAGRESNDIVHLVDLFPTFARFAGGEIPEDRVMDGLDMGPFFTGQAEKSPREWVPVYVQNHFFGVKWRDWKLLLKEMDADSYAIRELGYPSVYNLIVDPKEEVPEFNYLPDTWVDIPLYTVME